MRKNLKLWLVIILALALLPLFISKGIVSINAIWPNIICKSDGNQYTVQGLSTEACLDQVTVNDQIGD